MFSSPALRSPFQRALQPPKRYPSTVLQQALSILRRPGIEAHIYASGASGAVIASLKSGNYLTNTGDTGLSTVDGTAGLVLDGMGAVGSDLAATYGAFPSWTGNNPDGWIATENNTTTFVDQDANGARIRSTDGTNVQLQLGPFVTITVGKTYKVTIQIYSVTSGSVAFVNVASTALRAPMSAPGTYEAIFTATDGAVLFKRSSGVTDAVIRSLSISEVTGIHASQSTAANRPIVRRDVASGRYSWSFDGTDSLALGSVPFQATDDHCVIVGASVNSIAAGTKVLSSNYGTTTRRVAQLAVVADTLTATWTDDAATAGTSPTGSVVVAGTPFIATARKVGNAKELRKNGVSINTSSTAMGATTLTASAIGTDGTNFNTGSQSVELMIKGTVSGSECLTLERFVASLTPNSPSF